MHELRSRHVHPRHRAVCMRAVPDGRLLRERGRHERQHGLHPVPCWDAQRAGGAIQRERVYFVRRWQGQPDPGEQRRERVRRLPGRHLLEHRGESCVHQVRSGHVSGRRRHYGLRCMRCGALLQGGCVGVVAMPQWTLLQHDRPLRTSAMRVVPGRLKLLAEPGHHVWQQLLHAQQVGFLRDDVLQ